MAITKLVSDSLGAGVGGSMVKLAETDVVTNTANVDFDSTIITSTYKVYKIFCTGILVDTDNTNVAVRVSTDGGSTFDSTSIYDRITLNPYSGGSNDAISSRYSSTSNMPLSNIASQGNSANEEHGEYEFTIFNPSATNSWKIFTVTGGFVDYNNDRRMSFATYHYRSASAVNGIRFLNSSGNNIAGGKFVVYGVAD